MKKIAFGFMLLMLLSCLSSAGASNYKVVTASPTPPPTGTLSGTVTDAVTGETLASVNVTTDTGDTDRTNLAGSYQMTLKAGTYTLTFEKTNYQPLQKTVTVRPGETITTDAALTARESKVFGVVSDAIDPTHKLSGVTVTANNGTSVTTDSQGQYSLYLPAGSHNLTFRKSGYINNDQRITVSVGRDTEANCSLSQVLQSNQYRVVLTWGALPSDLDSHLKGVSSRGSNYHVYYGAFTPSAANNEARLDVDDVSSFGPETTTFTANDNRNYVFYIHDFSNGGNTASRALSRSGAKVEVYAGNQHLRTFYVPANDMAGIYWEVFRVEHGQFIAVDAIRTREP